MLETTHILTALALAKNINPSFDGSVLAFGVGLVSHFVLDAIPHYDFQGKILKPEYYEKERKTLGKAEFSKIGKIVIYSDIVVSFLIFLYLSIFGPLWPNFPNLNSLFVILYSHPSWVFGILGGIFPDLLNVIRWKTGFCWPKWFFEFHKKIQLSSMTTTAFDAAPKINPVFGLAFQIILVLFGIYVFVK